MKFTQGNFGGHVMIGRDFLLTAAKNPSFCSFPVYACCSMHGHPNIIHETVCVLFCCLNITNTLAKSAGCSIAVLAAFCLFATTFVSMNKL